MNEDKRVVIFGQTLYGWIWRDPQHGWTGEKTGEFGTRRYGFDGSISAEAWVLTNGGAHIRGAWVEA